ncbi:MAG TPA: hypothetical protein ENL15_01510 [Firmicutes bacterium]|nr:hypothetical protein [Bacillota bacterium]
MRRHLIFLVIILAFFAVNGSAEELILERAEESAALVSGLEGGEEVTGEYPGDLIIQNSDCIMNASVHGNLFLVDSKVSIGEEGRVGGSVFIEDSTLLTSENEISAAYAQLPGSSLSRAQYEEGEIVNGRSPDGKNRYSFLVDKIFFYFILFIMIFLVNFLVGPRINPLVDDLSSYALKYFFIGLGFYILLPVAMVLLVVTIIGIPVLIFLMFLFVFALLVGFIILLHWTGARLFPSHKNTLFPGFLFYAVIDLFLTVFGIQFSHSVFSTIQWLCFSVIILLSTGLALRYIKGMIKKKK